MKKTSLPAIVIWVMYALMAGCFLFLVSMNLSVEKGLSAETGLVTGAVTLAVMGAAVFGITRLKALQSVSSGRHNRSKQHRRNYLMAVIIEGALTVGIFMLMIFLRAKGTINTEPWNILNSPNYTLAQVGIDAEIPSMAHKGRELYLYLLRFGFFLLGNNPETVVVVQLVMLVFAAVCLYFGVYKSAGGTTAVTMLAFLGITPYMLAETCRPSAFLFVMIFYGLALRCISGVTELKRENKVLAIGYYLITGYLIGFCCYLEMAGITLLIFLTGELCFGREEEEDNDESPLFAFLCCLFAAVLGYFLCHGIRALAGGTIHSSINSQLSLYLPKRFVLPMMRNMGSGSWDMAVLAIFMALGIYSFWLCRKMRTKGIWFFAAMLLFLMQGFGMGSKEDFNSYALLYLLGAGMAGISIEDLRLWQHVRRSVHRKKVTGGEGFDMQQIESPEELKVEIMDQNENENTGNSHENDMKFQYIENPLPVPKKREHKVMDYDYEVAEDDDFDIP